QAGFAAVAAISIAQYAPGDHHSMAPTTHRSTQSKLLVSPEWLADHIGQPAIKVVDVRSPEAYADGHIPGAVNLPLPGLQTFRDGTPEMLVELPEFEARLGQVGIRETDTVILYDHMWGMPAARVLWALERYGHEDARILDGGIDQWEADGRPLTRNTPALSPTTYHARPVDVGEASHDWLRAHLNDPDILVVDTRTPNEYQQGHIPGAINWDWMNAVPFNSPSALRPDGELRAELEALGVTPDKEIVAYCRSGARSAHLYFALRHLGYPRVRNYDGSWLAWSAKET
ncbi:MAG: sulfurtransferase, partial [Anaerolineae bacterium]